MIAKFKTIQPKNCDQTKKLNLWFYFAINVLNTALLNANNYIMQCFSYSTRRENDNAHAKIQWFDIEIPSIWNLKEIAWKQIILWWWLIISSFLLHLMYNNVIFDTFSNYTYNDYTMFKKFIFEVSYNIIELKMRYKNENLILSNDNTRQFDSFWNHNSNIKLKPLNSKNVYRVMKSILRIQNITIFQRFFLSATLSVFF